jgi:hypothetical protein
MVAVNSCLKIVSKLSLQHWPLLSWVRMGSAVRANRPRSVAWECWLSSSSGWLIG